MTSDLWTIFLNLIAAFIYAGIIWLWQQRGQRISHSKPEHLPQLSIKPSDPDYRARNRQIAERAVHRFTFYFVTFAALYLSITMPLVFKALFSKTQVLLSDARLVGNLLPNIPIDKNYLQATFFVIAAVLYLPLIALAEFIASLLYPLIDAFHPPTERRWSASTMLIFFLFCIPVASTSVWLFYEKTFQDSLFTVLIVLFFVCAFGQSQIGRR